MKQSLQKDKDLFLSFSCKAPAFDKPLFVMAKIGFLSNGNLTLKRVQIFKPDGKELSKTKYESTYKAVRKVVLSKIKLNFTMRAH